MTTEIEAALTQQESLELVRFETVLNEMTEYCPEIDEKRQELTRFAVELVEKFQPSIDFFEAEDNHIGLLFAAALHLQASYADEKSKKRTELEQAVAHNFAWTLFGRYSEIYAAEETLVAYQLGEHDTVRLLRKYQNQELSRRLNDWLANNSDTSIREGANDEPSFEVIVLSIATHVHTAGMGCAQDSPEGIDDYIANLSLQSKMFMQEWLAAEDSVLPRAWVDTIGDKQYMCISEATARIILEPESVGYQEPKPGDLQSITSLVRHESIHTKGNLELKDTNKPGSNFLGIGLDEFRAEVCSGEKFRGLYGDLYHRANEIEDMLNFSVRDLIRSLPAGGGLDKIQFYGLLAKGIGLVNSSLLAGILPRAYAQYQSNRPTREIFELLVNTSLFGELLIADMDDTSFNAFVERVAVRLGHESIGPKMKAGHALWRQQVMDELASRLS